jgi:hypothetical protein
MRAWAAPSRSPKAVEMFSQANTLVALALLLRDHFATAQRWLCSIAPFASSG